MEEKNKNTKKHNLSLSERKKLNMEGVEEVITFNESNIVIQTTEGTLTITGSDLNIEKLNLESSVVKINGYINSFKYSNKKNHQSLLKRLFQ